MPLRLLHSPEGGEHTLDAAKVEYDQVQLLSRRNTGADCFSFIAIHGLNPKGKPDEQHAFDTWRDPGGHLWLQDELPKRFPDSRIFLYRYSASAIFHRTKSTFSDKANELLQDIQMHRQGVESRPIIFLCHSMGGLLVKQALLHAHNDPTHTPTKAATSGLVFFATPQSGGKPTYVKFGKAVGLGNDIFETLDKHSFFSTSMLEQWRHQLLEYDIVSFWGDNDDYVSSSSAQFHLSSVYEQAVMLHADHSRVCKFGSSQDDQDNLKKVLYFLEKVYNAALNKKPRGKKRQACHYLTLPKYQHFIGRESILSSLAEKMFQRQCRRVAIAGIGGIGKTQVAIHFAHWVKNNHPDYSLFFVPAHSHESFEQAYMDMARLFEVATDREDTDPEENIDFKDLVRQHLESDESGKWLIVVDNADDPRVVFGPDRSQDGIYKYLPRKDHGLILYTTRSMEVVQGVASNLVELGQLDPHEGHTLIQDAIFRKNLLQDEEEVKQLLEELCYNPLAIINAVAFINTSGSPISKYLGLLRGSAGDQDRIMTYEFPDDNRYRGSYNAIAGTLSISFDMIEESEPQAAALLGFLSCIEPKAIPQSIFPNLGWKSQSDVEFAIGKLCAYSFLTRREVSDTFDMHALVHKAAQSWTRQKNRLRETMETSLSHMDSFLPALYTDPSSDLCQSYLPHVMHLLECGRDEFEPTAQFTLHVNVGAHRTFVILERLKLVSFFVALKAISAPWNMANGQVESAINICKRAADLQNRLAEDHPYRLGTELWLAAAYYYLGDYRREESIAKFEHFLPLYRKIVLPNDGMLLSYESMLANAYCQVGRVGEAIQKLEHVAGVYRSSRPISDTSRLMCEYLLGETYLRDGQIQKAIDTLEPVVVDAYQGEMLERDDNLLMFEYLLFSAYSASEQTTRTDEVIEIQETEHDSSRGSSRRNDRIWAPLFTMTVLQNPVSRYRSTFVPMDGS